MHMAANWVRLAVVAASPAVGQNVLTNPGFESGLSPWSQQGAGALTLSTAGARTGVNCGRSSGRTATWNGPVRDIKAMLTPGRDYVISAWVRPDSPAGANIKLTVYQRDDLGDRWFGMSERVVPGGQWTKLQGFFRLQVQGVLQQLTMYVEGPGPGESFSVDDASIVGESTDWRADAAAGIEQNRRRDAVVAVVDRKGRPVAGATVSAHEDRRRFAFGTAVTTPITNNPQYRAFVQNNFEWGVVEYQVKWHYTEVTPGNVNYGEADAITGAAQSLGLTLRGHNIFWEVDDYVQPWVQALPDVQLRDAIEGRLASVVSRYRGVVKHWDVNNEMLHGNFYLRRLGPSIHTAMFQRAHELDPDATLFVNDYNVVAGDETDAYKAQIQSLLAAGAPVQAIGAQGHFGATVDPFATRVRLDSLAELGLPIWITEYDSVNADPVARADNLEMVYRIAYSHPAVDGVLMWGFWAGAHWLGSNAALVDADWTVNAAGQRFVSLMNEWRTITGGGTGAAGTFAFRGYHGRYTLGASAATGEAASIVADLEPGAGAQMFRVVLPLGCIGDFDDSGGTPDATDIGGFFGAWLAGDPSADVDGSGGTPDGNDIDVFFTAWLAGC